MTNLIATLFPEPPPDIRLQGLRVRLTQDMDLNGPYPRKAGLTGTVMHSHGDSWGVEFDDSQGGISIGAHDAYGQYRQYIDICEPVEIESPHEFNVFTGKKKSFPYEPVEVDETAEPPWWTHTIELGTAKFFNAHVRNHKMAALIFFEKDGTSSVEFSFFPDGQVGLSKAEALDVIAALRVLLAATELALTANDAPESEEQ